uniref:Protein SERAC1 n=1 Tax=Timema monikensis TaxID=170555 RepID=A0A7R9HMX3_9NEOP|nr:unnamed protein product [Timema monikensis]
MNAPTASLNGTCFINSSSAAACRVENHLGKTTLSTPDWDSNLTIPIISSLAYCESNALDRSTTEAGCPSGIKWGGLVLFAVHKTKTTINHIVRSEALDVENNRCEYIYIQDPDFHSLYEASLRSQGHERRSWLRSPTHWLQWWRKTRAWRLLALAQSEDHRDRLQAVQDLASLTHLTGMILMVEFQVRCRQETGHWSGPKPTSLEQGLASWIPAGWAGGDSVNDDDDDDDDNDDDELNSDCKQLAQACDVRTAVGLARTPGVDLRLFLGAPYAHITSNKQELVKCMRSLLTAVDRKCEHPCLQDFLSKAFPELQRYTLLELDLSTLEVPPPFISEDELLRASVESLLHHSSLGNNGEELINLGAIPLLMELYQHYSCDEAMQIQLCKLVSNLSLVEGSLQQLFMAGFVGVLAKWCSHSNIRLSAPSVQALSNMDSDQTMGGRYHPHIYLLHPTTRQHAPAQMDVVFIHGLLGGVFITWRQRDNTTCTLVGSVTNHDDGQALATGKASSSDSSIKAYLEVMDEMKEEEWEDLLEDYELVMADCPQGANEQGTGPFCLRDRHHCAPLASVCWPRDWLPKDCPNLRVIGVNYDTAISSWAPLCPQEQECHTLDQRSEELLKRLCRAGLGQRPLMWVGHSMGGLLVKSILVKAWQSSDPELEGIWRNTRAVAFYSVPHRGSPLAALRQTTQFLLWPSTEVQELRQDSPALLALHRKFLDLLGAVSIDVVSFAETKSTFIPSLRLEFDFVPPQSANPGVGEFYEIPQDHLSICKPANR